MNPSFPRDSVLESIMPEAVAASVASGGATNVEAFMG